MMDYLSFTDHDRAAPTIHREDLTLATRLRLSQIEGRMYQRAQAASMQREEFQRRLRLYRSVVNRKRIVAVGD